MSTVVECVTCFPGEKTCWAWLCETHKIIYAPMLYQILDIDRILDDRNTIPIFKRILKMLGKIICVCN